VSTAKAFLKMFISPEEPDAEDVKAVTSHRRAMVAWRHWVGWSQIGMWLVVGWAFGFGSLLGIQSLGSGFARAETVDRIELQLLSDAILQDWIRNCKATSEDGKSYFWKLLSEKRAKYYQLTGQVYELPDCKDLRGVN
jgi:hypothetical protein